MKKILCYFLLLFVLAACSKDETFPTPEISGVEVNGGTTVDGKRQLTIGEPATFSVTCENVEISRYEWLVNGTVQSQDARFVFTPDTRGSYTILVKIYNPDGVASEREAGLFRVVDPLPVINRFVCNDVEIGELVALPTDSVVQVVLTVTPNDIVIADYTWTLNGAVLPELKEATAKLSLYGSGADTVAVTLTNLDGAAITRTVPFDLTGPYKKGLFFYGTTSEGLAFLNSEGVYSEDNLFHKINNSSIGSGGVNDVYLYNNKLYLLTPTSESQRAQVVVCDAQTLVREDVVTAEGFNVSALKGEIYNLLVVNDSLAYVGYNASNAGNVSGVRTLDLKNKTFSQTNIAGTEGALGVKGPAWARMIKAGGKVWIGCGSQIQVIDGATARVVKTIEMDPQRQISDLLVGRDANVYAVVAGKVDKSSPYWFWSTGNFTTPASVVAVNAKDYSILSEKQILIDGKRADIRAGLSGCGACASLSSDELFLVDGAEYSATKIYRYNYKTGATSLFTNVSGAIGLRRMVAGYLAADDKGMLYVPTTDWTSSVIGVFKIGDAGQAVSTPLYTVKGDAYAVATDYFSK